MKATMRNRVKRLRTTLANTGKHNVDNSHQLFQATT